MHRRHALLFFLILGCSDGPVSSGRDTTIAISFVRPATVESITLEVSADDLAQKIVTNIPLVADSIVRTTVSIEAGSARKVSIKAQDSSGILTHRADTTISLKRGESATLNLKLNPIISPIGITVTVSGISLTVSDTATRRVDWAPIRIEASAIDSEGQAVLPDSLRWASSQPAILEVRGGLLIGKRLGDATVSVSYRGASVRIPVRVTLIPEPDAIEENIQTYYQTFHNVLQGLVIGVQGKMLSQEATATVANYHLEPRARIPREIIVNRAGASNYYDIYSDWAGLTTLYRSAVEAGGAISSYRLRGATAGSAARDIRNRAFTFLIRGISAGSLALAYDSVALAPSDKIATTLSPFMGPSEATTLALSQLDSAQNLMSAPEIAGHPDIVIPASWLGGTSHSPQDFIRLIRSYKAKFRAGVSRTPEERGMINWTAVAEDAAAGIQSDHKIVLGLPGLWRSGYDAMQAYVPGGWHAVSLMYSGMADTSGSYQAWESAPQSIRPTDVVIRTPDTRWPRGTTRAEQISNSQLPLAAGQYIANRRLGDDVIVLGTFSAYDHRRWYSIATAGGVGAYTFIAQQEIAMLQAEALLNLGNSTQAMALVNASRLRNGLPPFTDPNASAPGGQSCVPRMPFGGCGSLREALKYEKRMETQMLGYLQWFVDSRGWGDLIKGTPLHWPVPFQEMKLRNRSSYDMPSVGTLFAAPVGTYGF